MKRQQGEYDSGLRGVATLAGWRWCYGMLVVAKVNHGYGGADKQEYLTAETED